MTRPLRAAILITLALLTLACEGEHQLRKFRVVANGEERIVWAHYFDVGASGGVAGSGCVSFVDVRSMSSRMTLWICGVTKVEELRPIDPPKAASE